MKHELVDAFAERPVAARLQVAGRVDEGRTSREGLGPRNRLVINVRGGGCVAQFISAKVAGVPLVQKIAIGPELASNLIAVASIQQELTGKPPMPVILQPHFHAVLVAQVAQTADVIVRHPVRNQTAQIPKKTVRLIYAADDAPGHHRQKRQRIVTVALLKICREAVCPIFWSHFITVGHDVFPGLAIRRWQPFEQIANIRVEVRPQRGAVHLVHFQTGCLRRRWAILRASRRHCRAQDNPIASRHVPLQSPVRRH